MSKPYKLPSGNWHIRAVCPDGVRRSFTAPTKKEVELQYATYIIEHREAKEQSKTLGDATDEYIESRSAIISPTTLHLYERYRILYLQDLMDVPVEDITIKDIQNEINEFAIEGKSTKTTKNIISFFLSVMDYADHFLPIKKLRFAQSDKVEYQTPSPEDIRKIIEITKGTDVEIPVLLSTWCSLRLSEICGLKWSKVNQNTITIDEAKVYISGKSVTKKPKTTNSNRTIRMPSYIWDRLKTMPRETEYVVNLEHYKIYRHFTNLLEKNGIKHYKFHSLRHANASIMFRLGIENKLAQQRGGWSNSSTYLNTYVATFDDQKDEVADKIDSFFEELI